MRYDMFVRKNKEFGFMNENTKNKFLSGLIVRF